MHVQDVQQPTFGKVVLAPPTSTEGMPKVNLEPTMHMIGGNGGKKKQQKIRGAGIERSTTGLVCNQCGKNLWS